MNFLIQKKLEEDVKMAEYLKENSYWYKELNRSSVYYKDFVKAMKDKYHLKVTDKISDAIDNMDMITTILDNLK